MKKSTYAFTLIEIIFVILIIGILSSIGTQIFTQLFSSYYESKVQNNLQSKTEIILNQIANRLSYRIKPTTIMHDGVGTHFVSLESATAMDPSLYSIEWIPYDNDSRRGIATEWNQTFIPPAWSGLIDLQDSNATAITDPSMHSTQLASIIEALSYGDLNITQAHGTNTAVIIYPYAAGSVEDYGWYGKPASLVHPIQTNSANQFIPAIANTFSGINNEVYEHYYLAYTANAIQFNINDNTLRLYYNYQPWNGETYLDDANMTLLAENVTTFQVLQIGTLIKIQLCLGLSAWEQQAYGNNYSICKEQAVY